MDPVWLVKNTYNMMIYILRDFYDEFNQYSFRVKNFLNIENEFLTIDNYQSSKQNRSN